jgi:primosomal protein N'
MYKLDIRELKLIPKITEEKIFTGDDKFAVINEASDYVIATYKDIYNPLTVDRLIRNSVRDGKGETDRERFNRESEESDAKIKSEIATDKKLSDNVWEKYKPEIKKNNDEEWEACTSIRYEYEKKIQDSKDKSVQETLEEEMNQKIDDVKLQYSKKQDILSAKINEETKRDWVK